MKSVYQLDPLEFTGLRTEPLSKRPSSPSSPEEVLRTRLIAPLPQ